MSLAIAANVSKTYISGEVKVEALKELSFKIELIVCVFTHGSGTGIDRPGAYQCEGASNYTGGGGLGCMTNVEC